MQKSNGGDAVVLPGQIDKRPLKTNGGGNSTALVVGGNGVAAPATDCPPVVAIGASAGGLEAIEAFFSTIRSPNPRAFVIVQHLSPDFKSLMAELLGRRTALDVRQAIHGEVVQAGQIYLLPPAKTMVIADGALHLTDREPSEMLHLPIDEFFTSLAADQGSRAIGVILSGSGNDGARGTRALIRSGARVLVQTLSSAKFESMPKAAIAAGASEEIMLPSEMPGAIEGGVGSVVQKPVAKIASNGLPNRLIDAIQSAFGLDLSAYKSTTVKRRITRRMDVRGFDTIEDYADLVASDPEEQEWLYYDLLIGVTSFFRDPDAFEQLRQLIVPKLAELSNRGEEIRIWVPACATGEEAYSLAIMLAEQGRETGLNGQIRLFATDVHRRSLAVAAAGTYPIEAFKDMPRALVSRYFDERDGQYQIKSMIRRMLIFSPHDLLRDPPFTKLDLISCRNFLIYLNGEAQKRVLSTLAYALNKGGFMFLGPSESLMDFDRDFDELDKPWRIFRKRQSQAVPATVSAGHNTLERSRQLATASAPVRHATTPRRDQRLALAYEALLEEFAPPSVLLDERGDLVHTFGDTTAYLHFQSGRASLSIQDLIQDELKVPLSSAIGRAKRTGKPITLSNLAFGTSEKLSKLMVKPVFSRNESQTFVLVCFGSIESSPDDKLIALPSNHDSDDRIRELERDLRYTEENLQSTIEELETSNEELQASNEELMASNEELQSTNEELHSVNEELHTVSAEHQRKIEQLTELGHDMDNLLSSTDVAAIFVDKSMRIRRYTPAVTHLFNLMPQDLGRPIEHVTHLLDVETLGSEIREVIAKGKANSFEVHAGSSDLRMDIRPYRNMDGDVSGAALSFIDITVYKRGSAEQPPSAKMSTDFAKRLSKLAPPDEDHKQAFDLIAKAAFLLEAEGERKSACPLERLFEKAAKQQNLTPKLPELPVLQRATQTMSSFVEIITSWLALKKADEIVVTSEDTGEHWVVHIAFGLQTATEPPKLAGLACELLEAIGQKLAAHIQIADRSMTVRFEKMRGDRMTVETGSPSRSESQNAQAKPKLSKLR